MPRLQFAFGVPSLLMIASIGLSDGLIKISFSPYERRVDGRQGLWPLVRVDVWTMVEEVALALQIRRQRA
jgi:hypothetical protein